MTVLAEQFGKLLTEPPPREVGPPTHQPLDQVAAERSPAGVRRADAAIRYWDSLLRTAPQAMFALPTPADPPTRRRRATFRSRAAALALTRVVPRTGTGYSTVVLAAVAVCLAQRTGNDSCLLTSVAGNRIRGPARSYVGNLAQDALLHIDTRAAGFDEVVRRAGTAALNAYRFSLFDSGRLWETIETVGVERGTRFHRDCVYNDFSVLQGPPPLDLPPAPLAEVRAALPESRITTVPDESFPVAVYLSVRQAHEELVITLWADPAHLPRAGVEFLRGVERLLVAAAEGDLPLAGTAGVTGLSAPERGEGWRLVDGCWVEPAACGEVLAEALAALGAGPGAVFAVPDGAGGHRLAGYAAPAAGGVPPAVAALHHECVRRLTGRYAAMAPASYTVCAGAGRPGRRGVLARAAGAGARHRPRRRPARRMSPDRRPEPPYGPPAGPATAFRRGTPRPPRT